MSEVIPRPIVNFKTADDGLVVIYKPKFKNKFLAKHLLPRMKHPDYKIALDKNGSAVWKLIDGKRDALEIAEMLEKELGADIQPVYERLGIFLRMLKNNKFIDF
jgi:hypothetical protein